MLAESSLPEQKAFFRSFVKEVKVTGKDVLLTYTIPLPSEKGLRGPAAVLDTVHYGGAEVSIGRTFELAFNLSV